MENQITANIIQTPEISYRTAFRWSIATLISFVAMFLSFPLASKFPNTIYLSTVLAVIFHFTLLPVIAAMPAPAWTKMSGYTWALIDIILAVAGINGVSNDTIESLRAGVHVSLIAWPLGIAFVNKGFLRWASIAFAVSIGPIPLLGKLVSPVTRFIALPFILTFFVAIIVEFKKLKEKS